MIMATIVGQGVCNVTPTTEASGKIASMAIKTAAPTIQSAGRLADRMRNTRGA
jgi:hypothetical protein